MRKRMGGKVSVRRGTVVWTGLLMAFVFNSAGAEQKTVPEAWYVPRITAINPTGKMVPGKVGEGIELSLDVEPYQALPEEQNWQRLDPHEPLISSTTTQQPWCKVQLYMPWVLRADGVYKMYYVGNSEPPRTGTKMDLGYATSRDGIHWEEYPGNPIMTSEQIEWGTVFQTPHVVYDPGEKIYRMWFGSTSYYERDEEGNLVEMTQQIGYAESPDGISWTLHPKAVTRSGRCPSVLREDDGTYRMWVNSRPDGDPNPSSLYAHVILATSEDGVEWQEQGDVITPEEMYKSCVYPFVMRDRDGLAMWFGSHHKSRETGSFDITFARSGDGIHWEQTGSPVFPSNPDTTAFDGRYTSTPQVLSLPGRYAMYYSTRDMEVEWVTPDGRRGVDSAGIYEHIGYAYIPVEEKEDPTLSFSWSVDGKPLSEKGKSYHFHPHKVGTHTVTCRVENANGSASYTWDIDVKD